LSDLFGRCNFVEKPSARLTFNSLGRNHSFDHVAFDVARASSPSQTPRQPAHEVLYDLVCALARQMAREDIAGLHKRLAYWGVKIATLAGSEVGKLAVGLKGMIASICLDDLPQKAPTWPSQPGACQANPMPPLLRV
jgi:hypothetical protein